MSSWSDRQLSIVTVSGWPAMRTVVRNFPSNMREMGDLNEVAYLYPCIVNNGKFY
jgi:hypothetical protein